MLEFVDSGLYFVQDENNLYKSIVTGRIRIRIRILPVEKSTGSGGQKINGSDRIRVLIPACLKLKNYQ